MGYLRAHKSASEDDTADIAMIILMLLAWGGYFLFYEYKKRMRGFEILIGMNGVNKKLTKEEIEEFSLDELSGALRELRGIKNKNPRQEWMSKEQLNIINYNIKTIKNYLREKGITN